MTSYTPNAYPKQSGVVSCHVGGINFCFSTAWGLTDLEISQLTNHLRMTIADLARQAPLYWRTTYIGLPQEPTQRSPNPYLRKFIMMRDDGHCRYCGILTTPLTVSIDHVVPFSRGGLTTLDNLVVACRACNRRKHNQLPDEAGMRLRAFDEQ